MFGYNAVNAASIAVAVLNSALPGISSDGNGGLTATGGATFGKDVNIIGATLNTEFNASSFPGSNNNFSIQGADTVAGEFDAVGTGSIAVYGGSSGTNAVAVMADGPLGSSQIGAHTVGSYTGSSLPIYNGSGVLVGYIPIYA